MRRTQEIMQQSCTGSRIAGGVLILLAWMMVLPSAAAALSVGDKVSQWFILGNKQIPLPAGEWLVAGVGTQPFTMPALGAFGTIQTAVLFLPRGTHIDAVLEVNANTIPVNDGWGRTKACADGDQFLVVTRYKTGWETSCAFVEPTQFGADFCWAAGLGAGA